MNEYASLLSRDSESKNIMERAGVPCVPGYHGEDQSFETLKREAEKIGLDAFSLPPLPFPSFVDPLPPAPDFQLENWDCAVAGFQSSSRQSLAVVAKECVSFTVPMNSPML